MKKKYFLYWLLLCSQLCYGQVKDSVLYGKKIRVQSSSSICLQDQSLRIELAVTNPTNDSIAITFRFTNLGNKIMGIDTICVMSYDEQTRTVGSMSAIYSYHSLTDYGYCRIKCVPPGKHVQFTTKEAAPRYKTIFLMLIYIQDITFLLEKEKEVSRGSHENICYPLHKDYNYLELVMLKFEKNSQEIDILLPIKGCLCEPTLTPAKD